MTPDSDLFVYRATKVVEHAVINEVVDEPELVRVKLARGGSSIPFDIGAIAYMKRGGRSSRVDGRGTPVCLSSLIFERRPLLLKIFDMVWSYQNVATARSLYQSAAQIFEWCDSKGHAMVFVDAIVTSQVYREYSDYLFDRLQKHYIKPVTANSLQRFFCRLIELAFPRDHLQIAGSAVTIPAPRRLGKGPSKAQVSIYIKTCLALARGLSEAVLTGAPFPWRLNFDGYEATIYPGNGTIYTPYAGRASEIYNVSAKRIATVEEYIDKVGDKNLHGRKLLTYAKANVQSAEENLARANSDFRGEYRLRYAIIATKAYANLFIAITGCSVSELAQFDYSEAVEVEKSAIKKELSAVKFRAGGRLTRYALGVGIGVLLLKEYLRLRQWLLNGCVYDRLFFSYTERQDPKAEIKPVRAALTYELYDHMRGIYLDPNVPHLGSRMFRRNKSLVLHALGFEPRVVADALNHNVATNLTDYTGGTVEQQAHELGMFWKSVRKASEIVRDKMDSSSLGVAAGHCAGFNNPIPSVESVEIQPNCMNQFGCLFCANYICHPDEEDIHKLLSLHYVVQAVRRNGSSTDHAEHLFKKLSIRLQYILNEISSRSTLAANTVTDVRKQVEEYGILTPFWESRLQRYELLGVIF